MCFHGRPWEQREKRDQGAAPRSMQRKEKTPITPLEWRSTPPPPPMSKHAELFTPAIGPLFNCCSDFWYSSINVWEDKSEILFRKPCRNGFSCNMPQVSEVHTSSHVTLFNCTYHISKSMELSAKSFACWGVSRKRYTTVSASPPKQMCPQMGLWWSTPF